MKAPFGWNWTTIGRTGLAVGLGALALSLQFARAGQPDEIVGRAEIVSGDALAIEGRYIRLDGVDAPAFGQTCLDDDGVRHALGRQARERLAELVAGSDVSCRLSPGHEGEGVEIGACAANGRDLATALAEEGKVWPVSSLGAIAERAADARRNDIGIWAMTCRTPSLWRNDRDIVMGLRASPD